MTTTTRAHQGTDPDSSHRQVIDLDIQGMSCASCAARIEKKLNKVGGVQASVNYATEKAHVLAPDGTTPAELIQVVEKAGYHATEPRRDAQPVDRVADLRRRLVVAVVLGVPVVALSMVPAFQFPAWQWVCLVLATPVVWWAGWPFHRSAFVNARHGATTMDTLISVGTGTAYLWSLYALLFGSAGHIGLRHGFDLHLMRGDPTANVYFEASVAIVTFLLLGRWIEARSRREAGAAVEALMKLGVTEVTVRRAGREQTEPIEALGVDDEFLVRPGEKVATDGVVVEGHSFLDTSLLTGESVPREAGVGNEVTGGAVNTTGVLWVRATAVGADTRLARIATLVEQAQTGKANAQRLADKVSGVFVPVVMVIALATLVAWLFAGWGIGFALSAAIAVLIIACPCALGLATPTALLAGTGRGAQLGILIAGPEALERAQGLATVLLDKTGTLTTGHMHVVDQSADDPAALDVLVALERSSQHPVAKAIVEGLGPQTAGAAGVVDVEDIPGRGVRGRLDSGAQVVAGTRRLMNDEGISVPDSLARFVTEGSDSGASVVLVAWDSVVRAAVLVADTPRPEAAAALRGLHDLGLRTVMLTGDTEQAAAEAARSLGSDAQGRPLVDEVRAGVLPEDKLAEVTGRQHSGERVAMVGDGVNDAAALAAADLGISMGGGTDAAQAASDITVLRDDLMAVPDAVRLSRRTLGTIRANLFWAFAYNTLAIPVAAFGLLNPMIAGAAMAFSSVFVVLNSLRLRGFRASTDLSAGRSPSRG